MKRPPAERFWAKVLRGAPDECWQWTGYIGPTGYGQFAIGDRNKLTSVHRWSYGFANGPIPEGMVIDHTCHNTSSCFGGDSCLHRSCVNPAHLEAVTPKANIRRGRTGQEHLRKTHCPKNHEYTEANTYKYMVSGPNPKRACKTCAHERNRLWREKHIGIKPARVPATWPALLTT